MRSLILTQRFAIALLLSIGAALSYTTYKAIDNIVADQSRIQQQAMSPVFKLVRDELLRPLYISETFASSIDSTIEMAAAEIDEEALLRQLKKMEADLDLMFFVASERTRKQYFSNGTTLDLVEGEVAWYFEAKEAELDFMADLGQVGDVHLFFDVKMYGPNREFLGYVGVGKPIKLFLDTFDRYKALYGYDFLFVNDKNEIILTSLPDLVVTDAYIPTLESLEGFRSDVSGPSYDSEIVQVQEKDFLISEYGIEELGWRLLLLVPLQARQAQITRTFLTNSLAAVVIVLLLAGAFWYVLLLYKGNIRRKLELDQLTGLPNRGYLQRRFDQLRQTGADICAIIIDLDHFKSINDQYGHDAGDRVLKAAADVFRQQMRDEDIISRWGGEEFVMLIPAASIEMGESVAERARRNLESMEVEVRQDRLSISASFGVAFGSTRDETLSEILARADDVLYQAKQKGRNQVRLHGVA